MEARRLCRALNELVAVFFWQLNQSHREHNTALDESGKEQKKTGTSSRQQKLSSTIVGLSSMSTRRPKDSFLVEDKPEASRRFQCCPAA